MNALRTLFLEKKDIFFKGTIIDKFVFLTYIVSLFMSLGLVFTRVIGVYENNIWIVTFFVIAIFFTINSETEEIISISIILYIIAFFIHFVYCFSNIIFGVLALLYIPEFVVLWRKIYLIDQVRGNKIREQIEKIKIRQDDVHATMTEYYIDNLSIEEDPELFGYDMESPEEGFIAPVDVIINSMDMYFKDTKEAKQRELLEEQKKEDKVWAVAGLLIPGVSKINEARIGIRELDSKVDQFEKNLEETFDTFELRMESWDDAFLKGDFQDVADLEDELSEEDIERLIDKYGEKTLNEIYKRIDLPKGFKTKAKKWRRLKEAFLEN